MGLISELANITAVIISNVNYNRNVTFDISAVCCGLQGETTDFIFTIGKCIRVYIPSNISNNYHALLPCKTISHTGWITYRAHCSNECIIPRYKQYTAMLSQVVVNVMYASEIIMYH